MASTLGHALCGIDCLLVGRLVNPKLVSPLSVGAVFAAVFLANAPDLDLLVGPMLGKHHHYLHGQLTHSIVFALLCGLAFWLIARLVGVEETKGRAAAIMVSVTLLSHVIVDWFTGPNPGINPSFGTVILWPFNMERIHAPITLFLGPNHASMDELLSLHNVWVMTRETLIFGGFALALWYFSPSLRQQINSFLINLVPARFK